MTDETITKCQYCGKDTKNVKMHERFCKENPANTHTSTEHEKPAETDKAYIEEQAIQDTQSQPEAPKLKAVYPLNDPVNVKLVDGPQEKILKADYYGIFDTSMYAVVMAILPSGIICPVNMIKGFAGIVEEIPDVILQHGPISEDKPDKKEETIHIDVNEDSSTKDILEAINNAAGC